jgi:hypothetical protein
MGSPHPISPALLNEEHKCYGRQLRFQASGDRIETKGREIPLEIA